MTEPNTEDHKTEEWRWPAVATALARLFTDENRLHSGDLVAIRRSFASGHAPTAFFKLIADHPLCHVDWSNGSVREAREDLWLLVAGAYATLGPLLNVPEQVKKDSGVGESSDNKTQKDFASFGAVLFEAGLSELRLERLLRVTQDTLADELRGAVQRLQSAGKRVSARELANFVFSVGTARQERTVRSIARSYFHAEYQKQKAD